MKHATPQFKELCEKVVAHTSSKFSAEGGTSIKPLHRHTRHELKPESLTKCLWMEWKEDPNQKPVLKENGSCVMVENAADKELCKKCTNRMSKKQQRDKAQTKKE